MQTKLYSATESVINVLFGYGVSLALQIGVFPLFGIGITIACNLWIGLIFTVASLLRSYLLRRLFNHFGRRKQ